MYFEEKLLFPSKGHSNYRIPSIIATADGSVLALCTDRKDTLSDQHFYLLYGNLLQRRRCRGGV